MSGPVLSVSDLATSFPSDGSGAGSRVNAVDGVSFDVGEGELVALVGESGCGKSVTALSLLRLVPKPGRIERGSIRLLDRDILSLPVAEMREVRGGDAAMIFQEPMTSLNPVQTIGAQVVEAIRLHEKISFGAAKRQTVELFERTQIPDAAERFDEIRHGHCEDRLFVGHRPRVVDGEQNVDLVDSALGQHLRDDD